MQPVFGVSDDHPALQPSETALTAGRPIDIEVDGGVGADVAGKLAAAGANAFVAGSAVFKGGTTEAYKANISAIRNAAALARGEAI